MGGLPTSQSEEVSNGTAQLSDIVKAKMKSPACFFLSFALSRSHVSAANVFYNMCQSYGL